MKTKHHKTHQNTIFFHFTNKKGFFCTEENMLLFYVVTPPIIEKEKNHYNYITHHNASLSYKTGVSRDQSWHDKQMFVYNRP